MHHVAGTSDLDQPGVPEAADPARQVVGLEVHAAPPPAPAPETALQPNPERNAYFGETHLHTSWSVDAWVMGTG